MGGTGAIVTAIVADNATGGNAGVADAVENNIATPIDNELLGGNQKKKAKEAARAQEAAQRAVEKEQKAVEESVKTNTAMINQAKNMGDAIARTGKRKTILTSPLGVQGSPASSRRKTLLGS